jgi:hypothetical protein
VAAEVRAVAELSEVDQYAFLDLHAAREKINPAQSVFLDRLEALTGFGWVNFRRRGVKAGIAPRWPSRGEDRTAACSTAAGRRTVAVTLIPRMGLPDIYCPDRRPSPGAVRSPRMAISDFTLVTLVTFLLGGGASRDLLDYVPVEAYWEAKKVVVTPDVLLAELQPPPAAGDLGDLVGQLDAA